VGNAARLTEDRTIKTLIDRQRNRIGLYFGSAVVACCFVLAPNLSSAAVCDEVRLSFTQPAHRTSSAYGVAAADFNLDGYLDFAVDDAAADVAEVVVFLGNRTGRQFRSGGGFAGGGFPLDLAVGDFNGDGYPDLATASGGTVDPHVAVLINDGSGGFGEPILLAATDEVRAVAVGDFNGDNNLDVAAAVYDDSSDNDAVAVFLGNGSGEFDRARKFSTDDFPVDVLPGDFNGDGIPDLAVCTYGTRKLIIFQGDGTGSFAIVNSYPIDGDGSEIATADFNSDGRLDLAVGMINGVGAEIFLGAGDSRFEEAGSISFDEGKGVVAADFNGDGNVDLAAATYFGNSVDVTFGDGGGHFGSPISFRSRNAVLPTALSSGDFNGDGKPDVVTANFASDNAVVLLNEPGVQMRASDTNASEPGTNTGEVRVIRAGCTTQPIVVHYTVTGTAEPGVDYEALSGTVIIPPDKAFETISVVPLDDTIKEGAETVVLTLEANRLYDVVGKYRSATVTIDDND